MDKEKLKEYLGFVQTNFVENKTNQLILLGVGALFVIILSVSVLFFMSRFSHTEPTETPKLTITPMQVTPKPTMTESVEKILSASWNLNCQVIVVTSQQKRFLRRFKSCKQQLQYIVSPTGKYLSYVYQENNKLQLYVYSLENNVEAILDQPILSLLDFKFTTEDNLSVLVDQKQFSYYMIPYLYSAYPNNYDTNTSEFTDLLKKKTDVQLPTFSSKYASIQEQDGKINLLGDSNTIAYSLLIKDLNAQIIPKEQKNPRLNYNWRKRALFIAENKIKSVDSDGNNLETHSVVCEGKEVAPNEINPQFSARSPDGTLLAFVLSDGTIVIHDLVKDQCEITHLSQSLDYKERMSFSPNGEYLAFAKEGLYVYSVSKKQDYKIFDYSRQDFSNSKAITGPLLWSSDSRFICMAVSNFENTTIKNTIIKRIYFTDTFNGREQDIVSISSPTTPYACSPDGNKALYLNNNAIYKYNLQDKQNSLFKSAVDPNLLTKITWLASGKVVTNQWIGDETMQFSDLSLGSDYSIDESGTVAAYTEGTIIKFYDLTKNKVKDLVNGRIFNGKLLIFFN